MSPAESNSTASNTYEVPKGKAIGRKPAGTSPTKGSCRMHAETVGILRELRGQWPAPCRLQDGRSANFSSWIISAAPAARSASAVVRPRRLLPCASTATQRGQLA
jgi:hypothetical protein